MECGEDGGGDRAHQLDGVGQRRAGGEEKQRDCDTGGL